MVWAVGMGYSGVLYIDTTESHTEPLSAGLLVRTGWLTGRERP